MRMTMITYLLLLICLVNVGIAGYLASQNSDQYGWFLFVGFLFGAGARDTILDAPPPPSQQ